MHQDVEYHLAYLGGALAAGQPLLFADYVAWARDLLVGVGLSASDLAGTFDAMQAVLAKHLPPEEWAVVADYVAAGQREASAAPRQSPSFLDPLAPHAALAQDYLDRLLHGERQAASQLILTAHQAGVSVRDLYLHVFQPTQQEVGRLWQINQISVAQEHYCTAATQFIMSQLYPTVFATPKKPNHVMVATCVGGELHEVGVRMLADFFEMDGWDTYYLGAYTPVDAIAEAVRAQHARLLAISVTMTFHVPALITLIQLVRASTNGHPVKIMVGGYPFNIVPTLWQDVGADGYARNVQDALQVAYQLVGDQEAA